MTYRSSLCLLPLLLGASAPAPPNPARPSEEIVVQGNAERNTIDQFVAQLTPPPGGTQLGKFFQPVCPAVAGLTPDENLRVAERMRQVAKAVDVLVAGRGCRPNVLVLVVPNKAKAIERIRKEQPALFGQLPAAEIDKIASDGSRAAAWHSVDELGADGMPLPNIRVSTDADPMPSDPVRSVRSFGFTSRVKSLTVPQFLSAVVLIEAGVAKDSTATQLADYALMRALAEARSDARPPAQSILDLLDADRTGTEAPLSVTSFDLALLKSLYSTSNALEARAQRNEIAEQMRDELRRSSR